VGLDLPRHPALRDGAVSASGPEDERALGGRAEAVRPLPGLDVGAAQRELHLHVPTGEGDGVGEGGGHTARKGKTRAGHLAPLVKVTELELVETIVIGPDAVS